MSRKILLLLLTVAALAVVIVLLVVPKDSDNNAAQSVMTPAAKTVSSKPAYVGSQQCVECHEKEHDAWQGSHHNLAMQHADQQNVLGDFDNTRFDYNGIATTFFKRNDKFYVNTDGPDGQLKDFQVLYTFGVYPLQQYLVVLGGGRLQALGIAWDSRPKEAGGQRWFHLYPEARLTHKDRLHWTRPDQNWNYMCAECHSTNLKKNYDQDKDTYRTTWSEINVSCEACHGPASNHVYWAEDKENGKTIDNKGLTVALDERADVVWAMNADTGNARRSRAKTSDREIEVCARCHSRRSVISEQYQPGDPFMSHYRPALLTDFLYYPDGQIKEEVYVYGSFIQSKMYHQGVTCSDCHDPHTQNLRAEGNGVCLQCHQQQKYDSASHHHHDVNDAGGKCVDCHMPETLYMIVDGRRDHSIRIPRPDLSLKLDAPNACNQCHTDQSPRWADTHMQKWYGEDWPPGWHFGETLDDARRGVPGVAQDLAAVSASPKLPDIARASAASMLPAYPGRLTYAIVQRLLADDNPMVRLSALEALDALPVQQRMQMGFKMLDDPVRIVRIEAARIMAVIPADMLTSSQAERLQKVLDEYRQAQTVNAERSQSHINLGLLEVRLQNYQQAEAHYQQALALDESFDVAYVNLADLYRTQQQEDKAEQMISEAKRVVPDSAAVWHASGLLLVRKGQTGQAVTELGKAVELQPENLRYRYVYAVGLNSIDRNAEAIEELEKLLLQAPGHREALAALISYTQQAGDEAKAKQYAQKLLEQVPEYGDVETILSQYR